MYDEILVPTDGSEAVQKAAAHAYSHAERYDARLHVLFVVEQSESASIVGHGGEKFESLEAEGAEATGAIADEARNRGIDVEESVEVGTPHKAILDYADEHDVDLLVMSTRGRSGVDRFIMGSVTERVIRVSDIPVLAVRR